MKNNELWIVEAKLQGGKFQPFCQTLGCKSKYCAKKLAKEKREEFKRAGANVNTQAVLYRRVK
jgi:hypothetical protein